MKEGSFLELVEYDPVSDMTIIVYSEPIPLFQPGGNWNYTNCTRPPSYQQLLEVIPNEAPMLQNSPTTQTACSNQVNTATFTLNDADLDTIDFQIASSNPALLAITNISVTNVDSIYTITYSGINNQTGATTLSFIAEDGYGGSINFSFLVNVVASPAIGVTQDLPTLTSQQNNASSYQWIDCSNITAIAGATNQSYTATSSGSYAVVINTGACSDTSQCVDVTILEIDKSGLQSSIMIFPNPTSGLITILQNNSTETEIEIHNIIGRLIYKTRIAKQQATVDLSKEAKGVYFVKTTDHNRNVTNRKIIIQ